MEKNTELAGICGLFCGVCPMYPKHCHGCLSDKLAPHCQLCPNGFRECAKDRGLTWCYECGEFPCQRLEAFLDSHYENGISHHASAIANLKRMKEVGVSAWVAEEKAKATCPQCGTIKHWNVRECACSKQS